jgi:single-stranded DNA-specific DHH superfamily exonuclease
VTEIEQLRDDLMGMALLLVEEEQKNAHLAKMLEIANAEKEKYRQQTVKLHSILVLETDHRPK